VRLLFTDGNFTIAGSPVLNVPFLIDREMELVEPANNYLLYLAVHRGRTRSPQTWRNHGEALYDYFSWLEAKQVDWKQGCSTIPIVGKPSALAAYRNWSLGVTASGGDDRRLKRTTINQRLTCLMSFYRWAENQHLIPALPWLEEVRLAVQRPADFMRHTRASQQYTNSNDIKLRAFVEPPKLLSLEQCKKLLRAPMSRTIRLMTALMLQAGLRNAECRTFPKCYVFDPRRLNPRDRIRLDLSPEHMELKFEKPRTVFISWQMMMELFEYSRFGDRAIRSGQQADHPGPELFLNPHGQPLNIKGLNNALRKLWAGSNAPLEFRVTPHMLRHTYATLELYHQSQRMPTAQALAWVRDRLGHESVHTTSVYLHCVDMLADQELAAYQSTLDQMLENREAYGDAPT
jgi:integrase/recombinase XerD